MAQNLDKAIQKELAENAQYICSPGKGILAADESTSTIGKRFDDIKVANTPESRAAYRKLLFTTPNLGQYISGCILYEETLLSTADGEPFTKLLEKEKILPGIKVDLGVVNIPGTDNEKDTTGLDGLGQRCEKYYKAGARFAKWRAVLEIDLKKNKPSDLSINITANTLAQYAAICQANKLVPIVEPEILTDGDHDIETCAEITEKVLSVVFKALKDNHILLEGCLLKPNMVTAGAKGKKASADEIAKLTARTLQRTAPPALVGVTFLSGGQSEEEASVNLSAMNALPQKERRPWTLTFSYGRALQATVLKTWGGKPENVKAAQEALLKRAKANSEAERGVYKGGVESQGGQHVAGYTY